MRRRAFSFLIAALAAAGLPGCGRPQQGPWHAVDITGADYAQDFSLLDPDGRMRTLADFRGQAVLVFFGFTQCPDVCPTALARAAEVMQLLGDDARRLQVIFVTVDPERDTPELLRAYTGAFHPSFLGLHADLETTAATARAFKIFYRKVPTGSSYTMDHTALSYAYDPQGRLRLAVRHETPAADVAADIARLLADTPVAALACPGCRQRDGTKESELHSGLRGGSSEFTGRALFKDGTRALNG
jgi:protein SCO1/2